MQAGLRSSESEGQRRMLDLNGGSKDGLEIYPNLWAGVGLVRGGAGTALVGSHEEVADRIEEYAEVGIDEFVLSAYPHLEGAYWFGEGVLPILAERGLWTHPAPAPSDRRVGAVRGRRGTALVTAPTTAVVVGNPKPGSRTLGAAAYVARELTGAEPDLVVDLADRRRRGCSTGPTRTVAELVAKVAAADLVVVASPTYKATYTGLLKLFLDRFARPRHRPRRGSRCR